MTAFLILSGIITFVIVFVLLKHLSKWQAIIIAIVAPIITTLVYSFIGNIPALSLQPQNTIAAPASKPHSAEGLSDEQMAMAIAKLKIEVAKSPKDIEKLNLLANSYIVASLHTEAAEILENLIASGQTDVKTLLKTADSLSRASKGNVTSRANQLIDQALQIEPNNPQALWLAGMGDAQQGRNSDAVNHLKILLPLLSGTAQQAQVEQIISKLSEPNSNIAKDAQKESETNQIITLLVEIDKATQEASSPNDVVFVFAKAHKGPPVPLAVKRLSVKDLPVTVNLSATDAMLPNMTIDNFTEIELSAKISKTGDPANKTGDILSNQLIHDTTKPPTELRLLIK